MRLLCSTRSHRLGFLRLSKCGYCASILVIALAFFCVDVSGQETQSARNSTDTLSTRDPDAIALIQAAINAMGGQAEWGSFHSAQVKGTMIESETSGALPFVWSDEWASETQMRRDKLGKDGKHQLVLQDKRQRPNNSAPAGAAKNTSSEALILARRPRFDLIDALIIHLPGSALYAALQKPTYGISKADPTHPNFAIPSKASDPTGAHCVRITKTKASSEGIADVIVCFSDITHLPTEAYIALPELIHQTSFRSEHITYNSFKKCGAVYLPETVNVFGIARKRKTLHFEEVVLNPAMDETSLFRSAR